MVNLETLKKDVYKRERKILFRKFILGNILVVIFLSITLSGTRVTEREKELIILNKEVTTKRDSLIKLNTVLISMKEKDNEIIRKSLSMSRDTSYIDKNLTVSDMFTYTNKQLAEYNNIEKIVNDKWDFINSIPNGLPLSLVDFDGFGDGFGYRKHPITNKISFHEGMDIDALLNSEVISTSDGIVDKAIKNLNGYGNMIVINHQNGYKTLYAHLTAFNVVVGQKVKKNDVIGYVGNTGTSTGTHLHYEVLIKNRPINPMDFINIEDENILATNK